MKQKRKKSMAAGVLFGVAMAVSFGLVLGPVWLVLGVPFAFLGMMIFRELDDPDKK